MKELLKEGSVAHYSKSENLELILEKKQILLSHVERFDDPRESSLDWISTEGVGDGPDLEEWQNAETLKKSYGKKINILCTCRSIERLPESCPIEASIFGKPRMWSQYGGNSKGFCLIFNQDKLNNEILKLAEKPEHFISGPVEYLEWLHHVSGGITIQYFTDYDLSIIDPFDRINENNMLKSIYFKKSVDWEDESEFRWLLYSESENPIFVPIQNCLEAVVLGFKFPNEKVNDALKYCKDLNCSCFKLNYFHPKYEIIQL